MRPPLFPVHYANRPERPADSQRAHGNFDGYHRSFPFQDLHRLGALNPTTVRCAATGSGAVDNVACETQRAAAIQPFETTHCVFVGAAESGSFLGRSWNHCN